MYDKYFDWAATAAPDPEIVQYLSDISLNYFGNPSSMHLEGKKARALLEESRQRCAKALGCAPSSVYFSSGGTESNNLVLLSLLRRPGTGHVISSEIEHPSAYGPLKILEERGYSLSYIGCNSDGRVDPERVAKAVGKDTRLISIMAVNNESGAIQPIGEISRLARKRAKEFGRDVHIHSDAVQALAKIPINLQQWGIDSASFSLHKIGGPRGIGILYTSSPFQSLFLGGGQEGGIRSGTENTAAIAAAALAIEKRMNASESDIERASLLSKSLINGITSIPDTFIIPPQRVKDGDASDSLFSPFILSVSFPPVPGETLVRVMSDRGYAISTGSACSSRKKTENRVLRAMGLEERIIQSAVRISIGFNTKESAIRDLCSVLADTQRELR